MSRERFGDQTIATNRVCKAHYPTKGGCQCPISSHCLRGPYRTMEEWERHKAQLDQAAIAWEAMQCSVL